jgi:hypothetical protein
MYNEEVKKQPEYFEAANQIAGQLLERFQPKELAELLTLLNQRVREEWGMRVEKARCHAREIEEAATPLLGGPIPKPQNSYAA